MPDEHDPARPPTTPTATFCATIVDQWVDAGLRAAFVAPGSRSTPLALALLADDRLRVELFHDERAASFAALGHGLASGLPAVVLCTSGTAAAHFAAAVAEADQSGVPLLVCTADRPPELWDTGAPQTMDQTHLFGHRVRWFTEPGVPDAERAPTWRAWAARAWAEAVGWNGRPGPVHANLSFRDPLVGAPGELPTGLPGAPPVTPSAPSDAQLVDVARRLDRRRGVIVAGAGAGDPEAVLTLSEALGWPVLADPRSEAAVAGRAVAHGHLLASAGWVADHPAEVVLRLGEPPASKPLNQWLAGLVATGAELVVGAPRGRWIDPERSTATVVAAHGLAAGLVERVGPTTRGERGAWLEADATVADAVDAWTAAHPDTEPALARRVLQACPADSDLVVASSMPIRDVEWYGGHRPDVRVLANRGVNGIDGTIATAVGVAVAGGRPTTVLLGDVAFLHDSTSLIGLSGRRIGLDVIVVDNDGGGIFSFLPQATLVPSDRFEKVFGTPHGVDLGALAAAHRLPVGHDLGGLGRPGVHVHLVRTTRADVVADHRALDGAVGEALAR